MKGLLLDNNNDMMFTGMDFTIGDIDGQTAEAIITAHYGEIKEIPTMGFGASRMLGGNINPVWKNEIRESLNKGLLKAKTIDMTNTEINVEI